MQKLIPQPQAIKRIGISRNRYYELRNTHPQFPQAVKLGKRDIHFVTEEIDAFAELIMRENRTSLSSDPVSKDTPKHGRKAKPTQDKDA